MVWTINNHLQLQSELKKNKLDLTHYDLDSCKINGCAWLRSNRFWSSWVHMHATQRSNRCVCTHTHIPTQRSNRCLLSWPHMHVFIMTIFSHVKFTLLVNFRKVKLYILHRKGWADAGHLRLNSAAPGRSCGWMTSASSWGFRHHFSMRWSQ